MLGREHARFPKGLALEPHRHKAPPLQNKIFALSDKEVRSKYREVIAARLLMKPLDPMLKNFQFDQLSAAEQAKYDEEASKIEEEQLQMGVAMSEEERSGRQSPTRMAVDHWAHLCSQSAGPKVFGATGHLAQGDKVEDLTKKGLPTSTGQPLIGQPQWHRGGSPEWHAQAVPSSYTQVPASGKGVPMHGKMFTPQSELERWSRGIAPDPLQYADPWVRGAADGAGGGAGEGFRADVHGGFNGFSGDGGHCGQGRGHDWSYGTRPQYSDCQKLKEASSSNFLSWEVDVDRWNLITGHPPQHRVFKIIEALPDNIKKLSNTRPIRFFWHLEVWHT